MTADLVVANARVLTMDPAPAAGRGGGGARRPDHRRWATVRRWRTCRGPATRIIDAAGATVLPGFIEAHMHVFPGGAGLASLQLDGVHGLEALARSVRAWAAAHPDDPIIYGVSGILPASCPSP